MIDIASCEISLFITNIIYNLNRIFNIYINRVFLTYKFQYKYEYITDIFILLVEKLFHYNLVSQYYLFAKPIDTQLWKFFCMYVGHHFQVNNSSEYYIIWVEVNYSNVTSFNSEQRLRNSFKSILDLIFMLTFRRRNPNIMIRYPA